MRANPRQIVLQGRLILVRINTRVKNSRLTALSWWLLLHFLFRNYCLINVIIAWCATTVLLATQLITAASSWGRIHLTIVVRQIDMLTGFFFYSRRLHNPLNLLEFKVNTLMFNFEFLHFLPNLLNRERIASRRLIRQQRLKPIRYELLRWQLFNWCSTESRLLIFFVNLIRLPIEFVC